MDHYITYEQPLNERIRSFLRLEFLFNVLHQRKQQTTIQDTRDCLQTLLDVMDLLSRSDLKSEIIKELERYASNLSAMSQNPNVDRSQLSNVLYDINTQLDALHRLETHPSKLFQNHDLINSVKQRMMITGGGCNFDLPNYHYWLNLPLDIRNELINEIYYELSGFDQAINLCLQMLRNMNAPTSEVATSGFFQMSLEPSRNYQLIRIQLDNQLILYPEISAGKHRFSIRLMSQENFGDRPHQVKDDIAFRLFCCIS